MDFIKIVLYVARIGCIAFASRALLMYSSNPDLSSVTAFGISWLALVSQLMVAVMYLLFLWFGAPFPNHLGFYGPLLLADLLSAFLVMGGAVSTISIIVFTSHNPTLPVFKSKEKLGYGLMAFSAGGLGAVAAFFHIVLVRKLLRQAHID